MNCKADNCGRRAVYKTAQLCQKHYFRVRRTGSYEKRESIRKYAIQTPNGYRRVYSPAHPLACSRGYVFEHRKVVYDALRGSPISCAMCRRPESWATCHVDHINDARTDNELTNLRVLCRACNVMRGHTATSMSKTILTIEGVSMSAYAWSRQDGVKVSSTTILRRKRCGMSDRDAVYREKATHIGKSAKKPTAKYDKLRGIGL